MDNYKSLLAVVGDSLKAQQFIRKGDTFYLFKDNNWGLINFQKSRNSLTPSVSFTLNIGVISARLRKILYKNDLEGKANIEDCHWKKRIGFLLPVKQDYWWLIGPDTSLEHLINEILTILETLAIPEIERHITDEALKLMWLTGAGEGATELQRYIYLTTLLKLSSDDRLAKIVGDLVAFSKGKSYEFTAKEHIKELETYV